MINSQPLVSVIVPAYNCAGYIVQTLNSLFAQTYSSLEIVVINDGSTDNTLQILKPFSDAQRIKLLDQRNQGVAAARNAGLQIAQGELIAFIDSDDFWFPQKIAMQVAYLQAHAEVGAVYSAWKEWHADAEGVFPEPLSLAPSSVDMSLDTAYSGWVYNQLLLDCIIHTSSILVRHRVLDTVGGFNAALKIGEDYDLWLRLSRVTKIDKLATPLSLYKIHPQSLTKKKPLTVCAQAVVIESAIAKWGYVGPDGTQSSKIVLDEMLANIYFGFAYQHFKYGNRLFAVRYVLQQMLCKPAFFRKMLGLIGEKLGKR
jgi:glycosyltransferase involved in cell wall biosynthesis